MNYRTSQYRVSPTSNFGLVSNSSVGVRSTQYSPPRSIYTTTASQPYSRVLDSSDSGQRFVSQFESRSKSTTLHKPQLHTFVIGNSDSHEVRQSNNYQGLRSDGNPYQLRSNDKFFASERYLVDSHKPTTDYPSFGSTTNITTAHSASTSETFKEPYTRTISNFGERGGLSSNSQAGNLYYTKVVTAAAASGPETRSYSSYGGTTSYQTSGLDGGATNAFMQTRSPQPGRLYESFSGRDNVVFSTRENATARNELEGFDGRPVWSNSHHTERMLHGSNTYNEYTIPVITKTEITTRVSPFDGPRDYKSSVTSQLSMHASLNDTASVKSVEFVNHHFDKPRIVLDSGDLRPNSDFINNKRTEYQPMVQREAMESQLQTYSAKKAANKTTQSIGNIYSKVQKSDATVTDSFIDHIFQKKTKKSNSHSYSEIDQEVEKRQFKKLDPANKYLEEIPSNTNYSEHEASLNEETLSNKDLFLKRLNCKKL